MVTLWWCALGLLCAVYFALAGYDYGVGMLLRVFGRGDDGQRQVLAAPGPFFLGNEVWLVAAAGVLFGAFPHLEGHLFAGAYVLVVTLLLGLMTFTASVQLRGRRPDARRGGWAFGITAGALTTTVSWGLFLGNLVIGLPLTDDGSPVDDVLALFTPYALLWGLGFVALLALQGAVFLTARGPGDLVGRARRLSLALVVPALAFLVVATLWGLAVVRTTSWFAAPVVGAAFSSLAGCWLALRADRFRLALLASMLLSATPVLLVGLIRFPVALSSSGSYELTVTDAAAAPETLTLLGFFALPAFVIVTGLQWLTWRAHRGRVDQHSLLHF